jgi:hypothetical protein
MSVENEIKKLRSQIDSLKGQKIDIDIAGVIAANKELSEAKKKITELNSKTTLSQADKDNIKSLQEDMAKVRDTINEAGSATNYIKNQISDSAEEMKYFYTNTKFQYLLSQEIADSYLGINRELGITGNKSLRVSENFKASLPDIQRMGGDVKEIAESYKNFSEQSGRQNILSAENLKNMIAFSKSTGIAVGEASKLYERFTLMGHGIDDSHKLLEEIVHSSNKLGVNSTKVLKVLTQNMESMQRMSFRGGVKAMTEMAQLAVKMRMDISDMLGMADKFYEPEAAIEAAAQLQLMGGDIAQAFGDPFETMYLARNKPEELAKKLQGMTENMVAFNEETGQYELPAEARQQLSFAAEQLGISKDNLIDMSIQSSKIKDLKMNVSGNITDDDMRETIAGMAQMKDGKFKVDVGGEQIDIAELTEEDAKKISSLGDSQQQTMREQAQATMTNTETIEANTAALKSELIRTLDVYSLIDQTLKKPFQAVNNLAGSTVTTLNNTSIVRDIKMEVSDLTTGISDELTTPINNLSAFIENLGSQLSKPQKVSVNGTINHSPISLNNNGQNSQVALTPQQQSQINKMVVGNIIQGASTLAQSGQGTPGAINYVSEF